MAKSRVAPIKTVTLPRLELLAALLGANITNYIVQTLEPVINSFQIYLWSDSQIVLSWLNSKKKLPQFIAARVEKINNLTKMHTWGYCPSAKNPADLITRGMNGNTLIEKSTSWLQGPQWLSDEEKWPKKETLQLSELYIQHQEVKEESKQEHDLLKSLGLEKHSNFGSLIRVLVFVLRFIDKCRKRHSPISKVATTKEINRAQTLLLQNLQENHFKIVKELLTNKKKLTSKSPAIIQQLGLFLDTTDLLIKCRGRIEYSKLHPEAQFPILLPKYSDITKLIIRTAHQRVMHNGVRDTLTEIRQQYWIPCGRQVVKNVLRQCITCKKCEGRPFHSVPTPPMPKSRVAGQHAFQFTGVDYAGPLFVQGTTKTPAKVNICLFTCASIRAIHLELVEDSTTPSFIRAFRRFISRRGVPEVMISDNAKQFKAASKELVPKEDISTKDDEDIENTISTFLANRGVKWQFIAERAPWWGGFYERLVGSVKRCLKKTLGKASLNYIELNTILTEVEAVLNSRPLTYTYTDIEDRSPLTPSHFLCGHRLLSLPTQTGSSGGAEELYSPHEENRQSLTRRAKHYNTLMERFWVTWRKEYLTSLREYNLPKRSLPERSPHVGDVVLVHDNCPRNQWKLAVIKELFPGQDGLTRSVMVKTSNGNCLKRPIEKLYPLELSVDESTHEETPKPSNTSSRPPRDAAEQAKLRLKEMAESNAI